MNDSKTEMMIFASPHFKRPVLSISVGAEFQQPARQVRNLDMTLDMHLTMKAHIKRVCQFSYFQLKTIRTV